jgi:hypothetical protein
MRREFFTFPCFSLLFLLKNYFKLSNFCCFIAVEEEAWAKHVSGCRRLSLGWKFLVSLFALWSWIQSQPGGHKFSQEVALTGIYNEERISSAPDKHKLQKFLERTKRWQFRLAAKRSRGGEARTKKCIHLCNLSIRNNLFFPCHKTFLCMLG